MLWRKQLNYLILMINYISNLNFYKLRVEGGDESYYLIATAEQPISTMHMGEWLETKDLPIR